MNGPYVSLCLCKRRAPNRTSRLNCWELNKTSYIFTNWTLITLFTLHGKLLKLATKLLRWTMIDVWRFRQILKDVFCWQKCWRLFYNFRRKCQSLQVHVSEILDLDRFVQNNLTIKPIAHHSLQYYITFEESRMVYRLSACCVFRRMFMRCSQMVIHIYRDKK